MRHTMRAGSSVVNANFRGGKEQRSFKPQAAGSIPAQRIPSHRWRSAEANCPAQGPRDSEAGATAGCSSERERHPSEGEPLLMQTAIQALTQKAVEQDEAVSFVFDPDPRGLEVWRVASPLLAAGSVGWGTTMEEAAERALALLR